MARSDYVRDQLVLAQHHVNDVQEASTKDVKDSGLRDLDEIVGRLAKTLPQKDRVSIARERLQKQAELAPAAPPIKFTNTEGSHMTTYTATELRKMAEETEVRDRANAFELGFAKAAFDQGLTEEQYQNVRAYGMELLKAAAESTDTSKLVEGRIKTEEASEKSLKRVKKPTPCA